MPSVATAGLEPESQHVAPEVNEFHANAHPKGNENAHKQAVFEKYKTEAAKRIRPRQVATAQYFDPSESAQHAKFAADPWIDPNNLPLSPQLCNGSHSRILIIGAGFGGIFYAVEALKAGFKLEDIRIIEAAGGFGGTWYWNRGPGLMCDVESHIYLPYLEEMGYMPKERYSSGEEIRQYVNDVASKYKLSDITYFGASVQSMSWDEESKEWRLAVTEADWKGVAEGDITIRADFVCHATGILHRPKLPAVPGLVDFKGSQFHTARWDYNATGGDPGNPQMHKLANKRVAIVGTGATAIQAVPRLAQFAKHLYVVQRTPSAVGVRGQQTTDPALFEQEIARGPGWQLKRQENFLECVTSVSPPAVDLVNDGWSDFKGSVVLIGAPENKHEGEAGFSALIDRVHDLDLPRQDRIRARVDSIVENKQTAESLKAWYPGWCKRPCFHDEYLSAFNEPHVTLLDTNGQSVEAATRDGIVVNGTEYPVDVLVWSTGFNANGVMSGDPATRGAMDIIGKNGRSLRDMWAQETPRTLHSVISSDFPNLFLMNSLQGGISIVITYLLRQMAIHAAYIMSTALAQSVGSSEVSDTMQKVVIEPFPEAVDAWELAVSQSGNALNSAMAGCTPGYYNMEGLADEVPPEMRIKKAKTMPWGKGMLDLRRVLEEWREEGSMRGLKVR